MGKILVVLLHPQIILGKQVYIQSLGMNHCIRAEILHQLFANVINLLSAEYGNTRPFSVNVESYHI